MLPLFLDIRRSEDHQLAAYSPLIWRYHSVEATTTIGLPLYFDVNRFGESRTTGLLPLFLRNRSEVAHDTAYAIPALLTWWRTRDDHTKNDAVVFPLFWHFGGKNSTTVFAPLVWDFKRGESRTTVAFPLYAHWRRPDGERHHRAQRLLRQGDRRPRRRLALPTSSRSSPSAARASRTSSGTSSRGSSATRARGAIVTSVSSGSSTSPWSRCRRRICPGSAPRPPRRARCSDAARALEAPAASVHNLGVAKSANRVEALTGARAFAGLYILFLHFGRPLFARAPAWAEALRQSGYVATSFFLMLSGFVLTIAYGGKLADGRLDRRGFFVARIARLYPCYLLALVLLVPMRARAPLRRRHRCVR